MKDKTNNEILKANITRTEKHIRYCDLIIAACAGASFALIGVVIHMMVTG
jgi:hypothetical protein